MSPAAPAAPVPTEAPTAPAEPTITTPTLPVQPRLPGGDPDEYYMPHRLCPGQRQDAADGGRPR